MKAWIFDGKSRRLTLRELPNPTIKDREVLIKVKACGICGSDLHLFKKPHDLISLLKFYARRFTSREKSKILGHEMTGEVIESKGTRFKGGERVAVFPKTPSGNLGDDIPGCLAEYVVVPEENVVELPDNVSWEEGVLVEPLGSVYHSVIKIKNYVDKNIIKQGKVLIIGAGTIGLLTLQLIKMFNIAQAVYIIDLKEDKLEIARKLGADYALPATTLDKNVAKDSFDVIYECVGGYSIEETLNMAIKYVARNGVIVLMGAVEKSPRLKLGEFHRKEAILIGSYTLHYEDFINALNLISKGSIDSKMIISHKFIFEEADQAFRIALSGKATKAVIINTH